MKNLKLSQKAFTLIETLISIMIIVILTGILLPNLVGASEKGRRIMCAKNAKALAQALSIYSSEFQGSIPNSSKLTYSGVQKVEELYGGIFQKDGWTDLKNLICPSNTEGKHPTSLGYQKALNRTNADIDYWIVYAGNTQGNNLNLLESPGTNVIIIESFSGGTASEGAWTESDYHKEGGSVAYINGSASFETTFPENSSTNGTTEKIPKSKCSY